MARAAALILPALSSVLLLAACSQEPPPPEPEASEIPEELVGDVPMPENVVDPGIGTPLAERVATLGLLNKRNNRSQDVEIKPGESLRFGDVIIRLSSCERTAPWEDPAETGAFVQVLVQDHASGEDEGPWKRVFSGWLFKNSPSLNVVEHPVYDVWVKDCAMSFPGEDSPASSSNSE